MIFIDFNQLCIATYTVHINGITEDLFRHSILNTLRNYNVKFRGKYGKVVLCCDGHNYWRRQIFPYYKSHRKSNRDKSTINWKQLFEYLGNIKKDLREYFPYVVVEIDQTEADDIIATLAMYNIETVDRDGLPLIISSDRDYLQLQVYKSIKQWDPRSRKFLSSNNPTTVIHEHALGGDRGDGIPNFLSDDDTFVNPEKRQKKLSKKNLEQWIEQDYTTFCDERMKVGYLRNLHLVSFAYIPNDISQNIAKEFKDQEDLQKDKTREKILTYFRLHKLRQLTENIGDF